MEHGFRLASAGGVAWSWVRTGHAGSATRSNSPPRPVWRPAPRACGLAFDCLQDLTFEALTYEMDTGHALEVSHPRACLMAM